MKYESLVLRYYVIFIIVISLTSCYNINEKNDFDSFQIALPQGWEKFKLKGIDSYVGGISNGKDTLTFDFGMYSYDLTHENLDQQLFAKDTVNGKIAWLTKPAEPSKGTIGIYIKDAYQGNSFTLIGGNIENESIIIEMFLSIEFKDSKLANNSKNIHFSNKINPLSGKIIFLNNCASCHRKKEKMLGPPLAGIKKPEFSKWILDSTGLTKINTSDLYGRNFHWRLFGEIINENDIDKLIKYCETE